MLYPGGKATPFKALLSKLATLYLSPHFLLYKIHQQTFPAPEGQFLSLQSLLYRIPQLIFTPAQDTSQPKNCTSTLTCLAPAAPPKL